MQNWPQGIFSKPADHGPLQSIRMVEGGNETRFNKPNERAPDYIIYVDKVVLHRGKPAENLEGPGKTPPKKWFSPKNVNLASILRKPFGDIVSIGGGTG